MTGAGIKYDAENARWQTEDGTAVVLSDGARRGLLKLLGGFSRDDYTARGLSDGEAEALDALWTFLGTQ